MKIVPGGAAEALGLKPGDVLIRYDGKEVQDMAHFISGRAAEKPDDPKRVLRVRRGEQELEFQVSPSKIGVELRDRLVPDPASPDKPPAEREK